MHIPTDSGGKRIVAFAHPDEAGLAALVSNLNVGPFGR
jgi:hypothetical protein